jgi:hypothetical protein
VVLVQVSVPRMCLGWSFSMILRSCHSSDLHLDRYSSGKAPKVIEQDSMWDCILAVLIVSTILPIIHYLWKRVQNLLAPQAIPPRSIGSSSTKPPRLSSIKFASLICGCFLRSGLAIATSFESILPHDSESSLR